MATKQITLPEPHPLQKEIANDDHRFKVVACGRRWGKSFFALVHAFELMAQRYSLSGLKQRCWVVAPTFPLVREDWLTAELVLKDAISSKHQTEMRMECPVGMIEFKSAERDDEGLRGAGLDVCIIDEASRVSKKSWEMGIRPALADKQGKCVFISTPKGRNWFYDIFMLGKGEGEFKSWQYPTYTNPYFPKSEWEVILNTTPEMTRRQEYEADFLENDGSVFKNIENCFRGDLEEPVLGEYYTIGVDLGRADDFTVVTVMKNSNAQVVHIFKQNKVDWSLQKKQIVAIAEKYRNSIVYVDSTGLGDPIEEDLRKSGLNTRNFKFTNQSKSELVEQLIVAIEQSYIGIPRTDKTQFLIDELKAYSYEKLPSGRVSYNAPEGLHDDGVISLGLAVWGLGPTLREKKERIVKHTEYGTADYWDNYYAMFDREAKKNPFLNKEQLAMKMRLRQYNRILGVR